MSVPKKKPEHKTSPWPRVPTKPKYAPHDGPFWNEPGNPFPIPLQPNLPIPSTPLEWWWSPNHQKLVPVIPGLKEGERYASINGIVDYPVTSILGMGPEGALPSASRKGGKTTLTSSSGVK